MSFKNLFSSPESRIRRLKLKLHERRWEVRKHVYIEEVYVKNNSKWESVKWLAVDGIRIKVYSGSAEDKKLYEAIYERYYRTRRHGLLRQ